MTLIVRFSTNTHSLHMAAGLAAGAWSRFHLPRYLFLIYIYSIGMSAASAETVASFIFFKCVLNHSRIQSFLLLLRIFLCTSFRRKSCSNIKLGFLCVCQSKPFSVYSHYLLAAHTHGRAPIPNANERKNPIENIAWQISRWPHNIYLRVYFELLMNVCAAWVHVYSARIYFFFSLQQNKCWYEKSGRRRVACDDTA